MQGEGNKQTNNIVMDSQYLHLKAKHHTESTITAAYNSHSTEPNWALLC